MFHEIIYNGVYNCVTATALYAIMLDRLDIPYNIKETPRHVYLIAFPKREQILMESTDPAQGYVYHNDDYKSMFVQNLRKSKLISEQEFKSQDINELFKKYYYVDKDINLQQLISIHYSNNANTYFEKENIREFQEQIKKASFLYPCPRNSFLLLTSTLLLLENVDYSNRQEIDDLLFLSRFIDKGVSSQDIIHQFNRITYEYLVNSSRHKELDDIYMDFDKTAVKEEFKNELAFIYNYEKGRYFLLKGQYIQSYPFVKTAFKLNSGNSDAQTNLINNLSNKLMIEKSGTKSLNEMDSLSIKFPVLLENNNFIQIYGFCNLKCIEQYFKEKDPGKGNVTISSFEKITAQYPIVKFSEDFIGRAYSEAAIYYFKKGQNKKCMDLLNRGRELAPHSNELKTRLLMLR